MLIQWWKMKKYLAKIFKVQGDVSFFLKGHLYDDTFYIGKLVNF